MNNIENLSFINAPSGDFSNQATIKPNLPTVNVRKVIQILDAKNAKTQRKRGYHSYFNNSDIKLLETAERVFSVGISLLILYKPAAEIIIPTIACIRCATYISKVNLKSENKELSFAMLNVTLSVASIAYGVFNISVGIMISKMHELILNIKSLASAVDQHDSKKAFITAGKIVKNLLGLAAYATGSLEILVISMLSRILLKLYSSYDELVSKDHYIEALGFLLVSIIRCNMMVPQLQKLQAKYDWAEPGRACDPQLLSLV